MNEQHSMNGASNASNNNQQNGSPDGFQFQRGQDASGRFLTPGGTFEELLLQSSLPYDELVDWCTIYRKGLKARVPEMVNHAYHNIAASAGAEGQAKDYALMSVIGKGLENHSSGERKRGFFSRFRGKEQNEIPVQGAPTQGMN